MGNTWNIPQKAVQLLLVGNIDPDKNTRTQMWNWVQRSKARSLALTMGITGILPSTLLDQISTSERYRLMYEKLVSLQSRISLSEPQQRFWLRQDLDAHLVDMRKEEGLQELCDLRDGKPLRHSELDRITSLVNSEVVLVDWFYMPGTMHEGDLLLLTARAGSVPTVTKLQTSLEKVDDWVQTYLDSPSAQDRLQQGQARIITSTLNDLVQPLIHHTKPGDVLVFCSTMKLHRVPLHAIEIELDSGDLTPLIYRNPVMYSHSHSLLRICLWHSLAASESQKPLDPLILNGIRFDKGSQSYTEGRQSVEDLAFKFHSTPFLDQKATKSAFIASASKSRLIHVHSHVHWDASDPLIHGIDFTDSQLTETEGKLTAREVFALTLTKGSHVSLIACSGGLTQGNERDEVFGLVPAFLRAGASSTVSTLWKIPDSAGARFTEAFYRKLAEERNRLRAAGFINIARVFQRAVMERDLDQTDKMMHWTSFVPHGFCLLYLPDERKKADLSLEVIQ